MTIGKCPHCENLLSADEIREIKFRGIVHTHHAYVCSRCDTIIGFSSAHP